MLLLFLFLLFTESLGLKIVTTSYGRVRGITDHFDEEQHKYIFKGIPFVRPPLGELRFALPQKPEPWDGVLDATTYKAACLSNSSLSSHPQENISEDCLYLNIFTSKYCLENTCDVIVYYHGGSFNLDSATMFPDRFILERYVAAGIVFVIPAYRLGVLGQFWLGNGSIVPSNLLVYDAIEALHYVQKDIANFGGDPKRVTIMGHSSGGQLVNALGVSKYVDPEQKLFQKFIVLSAFEIFGFEKFKIRNSFDIAKKLNCFSENQQQIVDCIRKIDAMELLKMQRELEDNHILFKSLIQAPPLMNYGEKLSEVKKHVPSRKLLCGITEHEFEKYKYTEGFHVEGVFLDFENPEEVIMTYHDKIANKTAKMLNSDSSAVIVAAATYSEALVNAGGEVYLFETRQKPYSMHVTDMQYFIGIHRELHHTPDMDILDSFYSQMLVNFTKYEKPSPSWKKLDPAEMNFLALEIDTEKGISPKMEERFHEELVNFWLINMMELDKNITAQNKTGGKVNNETTINVVVDMGNMWSTITYDEKTQPTTFTPYEPFTEESFPIYNQWWFYAVIVLIVIIASILILRALNRPPSPEREPLLS